MIKALTPFRSVFILASLLILAAFAAYLRGDYDESYYMSFAAITLVLGYWLGSADND